jgi:hypothetical protein
MRPTAARAAEPGALRVLPGEPLAYGDAQTYVELPPAGQRLVEKLATVPIQAMRTQYGYTLQEARDVKWRARLIRRVGLTGAIEQIAGDRTSPSLWFVQ